MKEPCTGLDTGEKAWYRISLVVPVPVPVRNSVPVGSYNLDTFIIINFNKPRLVCVNVCPEGIDLGLFIINIFIYTINKIALRAASTH